MKTIIHVDQRNIKHNTKNRDRRPVITIRKDGRKFLAHEVEIKGPSRVIYSPYKPLSCGARLWIETDAEVEFN